MNDRDRVLSTIRRALGRGAASAERLRGVRERLTRPPANPVPARAQVSHDRQVEMFAAMAAEVASTVVRVPTSADVPAAVASYLVEHEPPPALVAAPALEGACDWAAAGLAPRFANAGPEDQAAIVPAFAGVAETGTLVLLSAPDTPTGLNFLPDTHVVVLAARDIVGTYEEVWQRIRALPTGMPRTVNMVTGPSRTGDIEQTIQLGAHGPRRLHIVIVDG